MNQTLHALVITYEHNSPSVYAVMYAPADISYTCNTFYSKCTNNTVWPGSFYE